jgi:hypothetical protein
MSLLILPERYHKQPAQFTGFAKNNYFARNLKAVVVGHNLRNPLLPNAGGNNSPAKVVSSAGVGWDGTGSKYVYNRALTTVSVTNGNVTGTIFALFVPTSTAINQTWTSLVNGYASAQEKYTEFGLGTNASGQYSLVSRGGLGRVFVGNMGTPTIGLPTFFACSQTNNASRIFCLNGTISSNTTSTNGSGTMYADSLSVCSTYRPQLGTSSFTSAGPVLLSGWINKALTSEELRRFAANVWQIMEPGQRSYYISIISTTGSTYNVGISIIYNNSTLLDSSLSAVADLTLSEANSVTTTNNTEINSTLTMGQTQLVNTTANINILNTVALDSIQDINTASALQATGNIQVSLGVSSVHGVTSNASVSANGSITVNTNVEAFPLGNLNTSTSCTFNTNSAITNAGGFSITESIALAMQSSASSEIQLEVSGTVNLTTSLEQAIASNVLINGQVALTSTLAENIVATLIANEYVGMDFQILSTFMGANPSVLARIGTQEILFTSS